MALRNLCFGLLVIATVLSTGCCRRRCFCRPCVSCCTACYSPAPAAPAPALTSPRGTRFVNKYETRRRDNAGGYFIGLTCPSIQFHRLFPVLIQLLQPRLRLLEGARGYFHSLAIAVQVG